MTWHLCWYFLWRNIFEKQNQWRLCWKKIEAVKLIDCIIIFIDSLQYTNTSSTAIKKTQKRSHLLKYLSILKSCSNLFFMRNRKSLKHLHLCTINQSFTVWHKLTFPLIFQFWSVPCVFTNTNQFWTEDNTLFVSSRATVLNCQAVFLWLIYLYIQNIYEKPMDVWFSNVNN